MHQSPLTFPKTQPFLADTPHFVITASNKQPNLELVYTQKKNSLYNLAEILEFIVCNLEILLESANLRRQLEQIFNDLQQTALDINLNHALSIYSKRIKEKKRLALEIDKAIERTINNAGYTDTQLYLLKSEEGKTAISALKQQLLATNDSNNQEYPRLSYALHILKEKKIGQKTPKMAIKRYKEICIKQTAWEKETVDKHRDYLQQAASTSDNIEQPPTLEQIKAAFERKELHNFYQVQLQQQAESYANRKLTGLTKWLHWLLNTKTWRRTQNAKILCQILAKKSDAATPTETKPNHYRTIKEQITIIQTESAPEAKNIIAPPGFPNAQPNGETEGTPDATVEQTKESFSVKQVRSGNFLFESPIDNTLKQQELTDEEISDGRIRQPKRKSSSSMAIQPQ